MNTREIVQKLWDLCNVLRDDGITYHQYVTELTYILFLKMAKETGAEKDIPAAYRWDKLSQKSGITLKNFYDELLKNLGSEGNGIISDIYRDAVSNIKSPNNLEKIVARIDELDWYSAREEGLGDLYEGLLEKNANEKKSGAGQYFTPRVLIDVIVRLTKPQPGERCDDPACGTFGFMIAAAQYVRDHTDDFFDLPQDLQKFEVDEAFTGCELVPDTHRLALMNAALHDLHGKILCADTLSPAGQEMKNFDVVLSNPPFGTKRGGERATRDDFVFSTSNKQLNFLQHIYRSLKPGGRAAVVLPDNVLFADGDGERIRVDLMNKCNLHTILRLPTGIFYSQGVKTNVLFFSRGFSDFDNTAEVWFYDLRTNMPSFGKTNPLARETFADFERAFEAEDRRAVHNERFSVFTRAEIDSRGNSLDLGLIRDNSAVDFDELPDPRDTCLEILASLAKASALISETLAQLNATGAKKNASIPSNWRLTILGDVCKLSQGQKLSDKKFPYLDAKYLRGVKEKSFVDSGNFISGDTKIILVDGENSGEIFTACEDGYMGSTFRALEIRNVDVAFFCYFVSTQKEFYGKNKRGSAIPHLNKDLFYSTPIPLPPLSEQERIVARLDSLFEKLDAAAEILQSVLAGGELRRSAILHRAFTGELTESWREEHGVTLDDWQECKLGDVALIIMGQSPSGDQTTNDPAYTPLIGGAADMGELFPKITRYTKKPTKISNVGDILVCVRATLGNPIFSDGTYCLGRGIAAIRPLAGSKEFFRYSLMKSEQYFYDHAAGSTFLQISSDSLKIMPISLPPLAEQKEIARVVGGLLEREAQATALVESSLSEIATLKKAILGLAFRGELGTNDVAEAAQEFELEE